MFDPATTFRPETFSESLPPEPGFTLAPKGGGRYEVRLWGRFLPGWLGGFAAALAGHRLSIVSGSAHRISPSVWSACFELDARAAATHPGDIDFLALAAARAESAGGVELRLEAVRVVEEGGAVQVEVRGGDQLGFLGSLLKRFAFYSLFPVELAVETVGGRIFDRFRLKGMGGAAPSAEAVRVLREGLLGLVEERAVGNG